MTSELENRLAETQRKLDIAIEALETIVSCDGSFTLEHIAEKALKEIKNDK